MQTVTLTRPIDYHLHLRNGAILEAVLLHSMTYFSGGVIMPNLTPPITTSSMAYNYRNEIISVRDKLAEKHGVGENFEPLMTCYLTDQTDPLDLKKGWDSGVFKGAKLYPAGATTNSQSGVTQIKKIYAVLDIMEKIGMPLLIHGEVTEASVDIFDREARFIETILSPLLKDFPRLRIVLEHITTKDAVCFIEDAPTHVVATVTPQHLVLQRNDLLVGGIKPHYYCLPVVKRGIHMEALRRAVTSGSSKFFPGTDSAPHIRTRKESACGCAGIFNAATALSTYITVFEEEGALSHLEKFMYHNGEAFYGFGLSQGQVTFVKETLDAPQKVVVCQDDIEHFYDERFCQWRLIES